jgi:RimJ/RimL family protein N-acetyltransferase
MEFFPETLTRERSAELIERSEASFEEHGYGLWALELPGSVALAGFVGLEALADVFPFAPGVEIGWRLAREQWGRGLATEAAQLVLAFAFDQLALAELVSLTFAFNFRSRAVMERIGMVRDPREDFTHPALPQGHPLAPHVLYRLARGA